MEKLGEEWRLNEISTTFRLLFDADRPLCFAQDKKFYSDVCGLGWRYYILADSASRRAKTTTASSSFELFFDPHLVSQSRYGELKLSTYQGSQNGVMDLKNRSHYVLPASSKEPSSSTLALFKLCKVAANSLFELTVTLPSDLGLSLPPSITPTIRGALNDALLGTSNIDAKFYLFSSRACGAPCRPRALFADSSLLKGHSSYLDTRSYIHPPHFSFTIWFGPVLFDNGFKESASIDFFSEVEPEMDAGDYGYDSDSDLESMQEEVSEVHESNTSEFVLNASLPGMHAWQVVIQRLRTLRPQSIPQPPPLPHLKTSITGRPDGPWP
jgi:hypothetical protein